MSTEPQIEGLADWRPLARGGHAVVWEARQLSLNRLVAVKVYGRDLQDAGRQHFARESAAAGRIPVHPGIVTTHYTGVLPGDRPYLVMDLCPGGSLTRWLEPGSRPTVQRVRQVGLRIAGALAAAHAAGILHRDVKPANILIDSAGRPRLADFGLAVERGAGPDPTDGLTPTWAPPEAWRVQPSTEAGDVFSLAATLYALLTGTPPAATAGSAFAPADQPGDPARGPVRPVPSTPLTDLLLAALDDDPDARPDAATFLGQLATVPLRSSTGTGVGREATPAPVLTFTGRPSGSGRPLIPTGRGEAAGANAAQRRGKRAARSLALAAALVVVTTSGAAWLVEEPASSGGPVPVAEGPVAAALTRTGSSPAQAAVLPTAATARGADAAAAVAVDASPRSTRAAEAQPARSVEVQTGRAGNAADDPRPAREEGSAAVALPSRPEAARPAAPLPSRPKADRPAVPASGKPGPSGGSQGGATGTPQKNGTGAAPAPAPDPVRARPATAAPSAGPSPKGRDRTAPSRSPRSHREGKSVKQPNERKPGRARAAASTAHLGPLLPAPQPGRPPAARPGVPPQPGERSQGQGQAKGQGQGQGQGKGQDRREGTSPQGDQRKLTGRKP